MSFRIEKKIFVKRENLFEFKKMLFDNGARTLYQNRKVQSIYFDNLKLQMYKDSIEGLAPRKKIRVRNYPNNSEITYKLEIKISSVEGRHKTSEVISNESFEKIKSDGIFDPKYGVCLPLLNVVYEREFLKKEEIRITIDTDINYNIFNNPVIKRDNNVIVELKTSKISSIDHVFEKYPYQEIRFSKYCNGIELFNKN